MSQPETRLRNEIALALGQEADLTLWRIAPSAPPDASGRVVQTAPTGIPDLCGILAPSGRWFALEIKTSTGRMRPEQVLFGQLLRSRGGYCATVRSVDEARAALAQARQEGEKWQRG